MEDTSQLKEDQEITYLSNNDKESKGKIVRITNLPLSQRSFVSVISSDGKLEVITDTKKILN